MKIANRLHHEYWPSGLFYLPIVGYYLYTSLRLRKINYFTTVNPALKAGGLCGFSKFDSYKLVPKKYLPKTILLDAEKDYSFKDLMLKQGFGFPIIMKPDQGERGLLVHKVDSLTEMEAIKAKYPVNFLLQEYVDWPLELGVFMICKSGKWSISSVTSKKFLSITGDGVSTISQLAASDYRVQKYSGLEGSYDLEKILPKGETIMLEPIGNHCRGTQFVNENSKISSRMEKALKQCVKHFKGINYCRLDLRTPSWDALSQGEFKLMEINGVSAEPGHIYDPRTNLSKAYKDLFSHWKHMAEIAETELEKGNKCEPVWETAMTVAKHFLNKRKVLKLAEDEVFLNLDAYYYDIKRSKDPADNLEEISLNLPIKDYVKFKKDTYNRVVLYSDESCELVLCCWGKGHASEEHHHPNKGCWFRCIRGCLTENRSGEEIQIMPGESGYIDDSHGPHSMYNMTSDETVSLHFYRKL